MKNEEVTNGVQRRVETLGARQKFGQVKRRKERPVPTSSVSFVAPKMTGQISEVVLFSNAMCCRMEASYALAAALVDGSMGVNAVRICCASSMVLLLRKRRRGKRR